MLKKIFLVLLISMSGILYLVFPNIKNLHSRLTEPTSTIDEVRRRVEPTLRTSLNVNGLEIGAPVFIRVFKEEHTLELWMQTGEKYKLFKSYQICNYSGELGPKLKEGDRQSPEGFYYVDKSALNPNSSYHLSFNLGFPNAYDLAHARTGSFLMIHGDCVSIGCYAMTDDGIEEIYLILEAALTEGQTSVPVHAFPFRMSPERLDVERENPWFAYWTNLKVGYDIFEQEFVPPNVSVAGQEYVFSAE